ncbi:hypothetical protein DUI87_16247 [Hirundo rustica rustica]|uniref:Uncharacterized protein n=1 Tax=Hirundo rustica rustica TaxID=333673 RepID=A0A3M0K306_HIRRU|nr:hypothetical protein DUI87_16247 [Hirundo rustica rustica]
MFTSTGSNGFYKAPLSKSLLLVPSAISILLTLLFQHYQKFFAYNLQAVKEDFQSFLLGAWMLSALFDLLLVEITQYMFGITINSLPSGLYAFSLCHNEFDLERVKLILEAWDMQ